MNWIVFAVVAQFLNAIVAILDKHIVSDERILPRPFVYAFYSCLLSGLWIFIYLLGHIPFPVELNLPSFNNIHAPSLEVVALSFLGAFTFFTALVSMFTALQKGDASDVVPVVGATSAIASFGLGYVLLDTVLSSNFILGIVLLAIGTFLVSRYHFTFRTAMVAIHAGIFFALHYVSIKGLFLVTSFDDGFFWSRIAFVIYTLTLLMVPSFLEKITEQTKVTSKHAGIIVVLNKILAGIATVFVLKATDMGDVAVVQALGGLQFVFILLFGIFFSLHPRHRRAKVGEVYHVETILQKALFVAVIAVGFLVLFR